MPDVITPYVVFGGTCHVPSFLRYLDVSEPLLGYPSNLVLSAAGIKPATAVVAAPYVVLVGVCHVASPLKNLVFVPPLGTKPLVPDVIAP